MRIYLKKENGITLVALIVTIIVLIILAGISIGMLTGENGLINKAQKAKEETEIAEEKEIVQLATISAMKKDRYENITKENLDKQLDKNIGENKYESAEIEEGITVTFKESNRSYLVDIDGEVKKIEDRTGLKVGDYINYEPDVVTEGYSSTKLSEEITGNANNTADITQDKLDWQILKIYGDGSIDVIGSATSQTIYFSDAEGYNNGVYVMDDICETLYSRGNIKARSVDLEDFEKNLTEEGKATKAAYINDAIATLTTGTYITNVNTSKNTVTFVTGRSYYPNLYAEENGAGIDTSTVKTNGINSSATLKDIYGNSIYDTNTGTNAYKQAVSNGLTVTYTNYELSINRENYGAAYKSLFNSKAYWLASRCVNCGSDYARFGIRVTSSSIIGDWMFRSNDYVYGTSNSLRPIVHLGGELKVETCAGENSTTNPHKITEY